MGLDNGYGLGIGSLKPGVCTSSTRPASPYDGQVIYMTDVDQTAVWDGTQWTVLAPIAGGRNVIINGAMQVAQRGTSTASITGTVYGSSDRFKISLSSLGTWTQSTENDAPTGSGFKKSAKVLCTTADASPAAGDSGVFVTVLEGQNVQQFLKGTSSAKQFSLSFWVKSNVTGTYIANLYDNDNTRWCSASYSISASATWEKKTIAFPADTTGAFDNDNDASLILHMFLGAGTTYTSGTLATTWNANAFANANIAVGQVNVAAAINNYWQITGVQLEAGSVATPFEFEDIGETFAKCQRYFQKSYNQEITPPTNGQQPGIVVGGTTSIANNALIGVARFPVSMRITPTMTIYSYTTSQLSRVSDAYTGTDQSTGTITVAYQGQNSFSIYNTSGVTLTSSLGQMFHFTASAEM